MSNFEKIYKDYVDDIYKYVFSLCRNVQIAEDITQETFFKAMKNINSFNGSCKMSVWLCQIAKNTYFNYYNKEKRRQDEPILIQQIKPENDFQQDYFNQETAFEIHKALHNLEEPYKEVFTLRMFGELSFSQIGELFGKTESWARVTFHRSKIKLKERL